MILILQVQRLEPELARLPPLLDLYTRGDPTFPDRCLDWIEESERVMSSLRLPEGSELSALRARIVKAADALWTGAERPARSAVRAARQAAAAAALERAEEILRTRLAAAHERLQPFEEKLCEGMTALMLQIPLPDASEPNRARRVWSLLRENDATRALEIYLSASLSAADRLFLMQRVLDRLGEPIG